MKSKNSMMKTNDISKMLGRRPPTKSELQKIVRYMEIFYDARKKTCKRCSTVMCVLGVVLFSSYINSGLVAIVIGAFSFFGAFMAIRYKNQISEEIEVIRNGDFQVVEGYVGEIGTDITTPGISNVVFVSNHEQRWDGWFSARHENLCVGLPLLLMYVESNKVKRDICRVFTPYMLTEEGMKHRV